jgi:hypothetical protein
LNDALKNNACQILLNKLHYYLINEGINMIIVTYGGGTNSTAILIGMFERGEKPDYIIFADTGGEKPHTYDNITEVNAWCTKVGFPLITIVKGSMPQQLIDGSLEDECLRLGTLPSKAYGFSQCSQKWKIDPVNKFLKALSERTGVALTNMTRCIGFDMDEIHRYERSESYKDKHINPQRYPLIEWEWGRDECVAAIKRAGIAQPGKSACFFCPSSKKHEIVWLKEQHPDLFARAIEIERKAIAGEGRAEASRCGLGRTFTWANFTGTDNSDIEIDCGCYDGD